MYHVSWDTLLPILVILRLFVFDLWAIGPTRFRLIMWPCDLDFWPWRSWCLWLMRVVVPSLKFVGLAIRKIWCTMCVSINGPGDLDLWPFDLETGMRVASEVGNLPSKFGHARPLGSRIIRYVRDGRTDRQTFGLKQRYLPPGNNESLIKTIQKWKSWTWEWSKHTVKTIHLQTVEQHTNQVTDLSLTPVHRDDTDQFVNDK